MGSSPTYPTVAVIEISAPVCKGARQGSFRHEPMEMLWSTMLWQWYCPHKASDGREFIWCSGRFVNFVKISWH